MSFYSKGAILDEDLHVTDLLPHHLPHLAELMRALREGGLADVVCRLDEGIHRTFCEASAAEDLVFLIGNESANQVVRCSQVTAHDSGLKAHLESQATRLVALLLRRYENARRFPAEVHGNQNVTFKDRELQVSVSLSDLARVYDWGRRPMSEGPGADILDAHGITHLSAKIGTTLSSLRMIGSSFAYKDLREELDVATWMEEEGGRSLELFFRDCLNKIGFTSRIAPLFEDVLEATDLRVRVPSTDRKRGTRVQVSWLANYELFRKKRHLMPYSSTIVMLCPFTLAQTWRWEETKEERESYWDDPRRAADEAAAVDLREHLSSLIRNPSQSILGPAEDAGAELLNRLASFMNFEGVRTNLRLRERQVDRPSYGTVHDYVRHRIVRDIRIKREEQADLPPDEPI